jgi:hypothetical protein
MLLVSSTFLATACGPQVEPEDVPATTQAALDDELDADKKPPRCETQPGATYVSRDPQECIAITYTCPEGEQGFFNDCGCGCEPIP